MSTVTRPGPTRRRRWIFSALVLFAAFVYLNNTSRLAAPLDGEPWLVAHRGVNQPFEREGLHADSCTAARMLPPEHQYLENTLASLRAAYAYGADAVEIDIQRTADGHFAVFHDWTLDCRTDGSGRTRDHTLAELQALDLGHGYTADGGQTFPFRGRFVGQMPSLEEVLELVSEAFADRELILEFKSNDPAEGELLAERLAEVPAAQRERLLAYGGPLPVEVIRQRFPEMVTITRPRLKRCLLRYLALGWTGHVPEACERGLITVPANVAPWLWGWPNRFLQRMDAAGSRVVLIGDYHRGEPARGFDDPESLRSLPEDYSGGLWTDRIEVIGPLVRGGARDRWETALGEPPPGRLPRVFAPGRISLFDRHEYGAVVSTDGQELYFGVDLGSRAEIRGTRSEDGHGSTPEVVVGDERFTYGDPFLSPDGRRLYFISNRPLNLEEGAAKDFDLWYVERDGAAWGKPVNLGLQVNSEADEYYVSLAASGRLYFASNRDAGERKRNFDLYTADFLDGRFAPPVRLPGEINTRFYEADPFVAPDESYILYSSVRPGGLGQGDLYISRRREDGTWSAGTALGPQINTEQHELCPFVTADGRFLLFTSNQDLVWVDAAVLLPFRQAL